MSPTSYRAAPPRGDSVTLPEARRGVNLPLTMTLSPEGRGNQNPLTLPSPPRRGEGTGAVGLAGLVLARRGQRPEPAPGAPRRQQPVGLAAEGGPEILPC